LAQRNVQDVGGDSWAIRTISKYRAEADQKWEGWGKVLASTSAIPTRRIAGDYIGTQKKVGNREITWESGGVPLTSTQ